MSTYFRARHHENLIERSSKIQTQKEQKGRFVIETKGYKETFDSFEIAKNQFEIIKKRAIKKQGSNKVKISEKNGGNITLIDELNIKPDFYLVD